MITRLLTCCFFLGLAACRPESDPLREVRAFAGHSCRLTSLTNVDGSTAEYQYDSLGNLARIDRYQARLQFATFEYNSDGTVKARLIHQYRDSFARTRDEFRYQGQRQPRLTEVIRLGRDAATEPFRAQARRTFRHDEAGRITEENQRSLVNATESYRIRYAYDSRNLIQVTAFASQAPDAKKDYEFRYLYDSSRNPSFRNPALPDQPDSYSLNNVTERHFEYYGGGDLCAASPFRDYNYRYNAQGYPTQWDRTTCFGEQRVEARYTCP
jgi:YD repeat-containing protein